MTIERLSLDDLLCSTIDTIDGNKFLIVPNKQLITDIIYIDNILEFDFSLENDINSFIELLSSLGYENDFIMYVDNDLNLHNAESSNYFMLSLNHNNYTSIMKPKNDGFIIDKSTFIKYFNKTVI